MITIPPLDLLSMATASVHDRWGKKDVNARSICWHQHRPFLPVWVEFDGGDRVQTVTAVPVHMALFGHDVTWQRNRQVWRFTISAARPVRFIAGVAYGEADDAGGAGYLALLRQDPRAYGSLLGIHGALVDFYTVWLMRRGIPEDEAATMSLKAFTDSLDRAVFHPRAKLKHVIYSLMSQRLLNQIRDRSSRGTLVQDRHDVSIESDDHRIGYSAPEPVLLGSSSLARKFAGLILQGRTKDEAADDLKLTAAELMALEVEIADALGFSFGDESKAADEGLH